MALLEFINVGMKYQVKGKETPVLDQINLSVESGEFITIVGPSGCGKSTLLKLAAGILLPTEGKVSFQNQAITNLDPKRGLIFQDPTLYPWLTASKNIEFGLKMNHIPKEERSKRVNQYLENMHLTSFRNYYPYELSGGMKQRVALARTLINNPELILMDEPFGALDTLTKKNMQELILQIWRDTKKTILFITHDIDEAIYLGNRIIVFSARPGQVIDDISITKQSQNTPIKDYISSLFSKKDLL